MHRNCTSLIGISVASVLVAFLVANALTAHGVDGSPFRKLRASRSLDFSMFHLQNGDLCFGHIVSTPATTVIAVSQFELPDQYDVDSAFEPRAIPPWSRLFKQVSRRPKDVHVEIAAGWPFRCFGGTFAVSDSPAGLIVHDHDAIVISNVTSGSLAPFKAFVLRPIWLGLIIDCAILCTGIILSHYLVTRLRGQIRRTRRRCTACGYPTEYLDSFTCPECGHQHSSEPRCTP